MQRLIPALAALLAAAVSLAEPDVRVPMRVATFNVQNLTAHDDEHKLDTLARLIRCINADAILINEVDTPPDNLTAAIQPLLDRINEPLKPDRRYTATVRPSNTGVPSGHDLDANGILALEPGTRDYAADCLGYGEYPGQYGMALLVRAPFKADEANVRTFAEFLWKDMPGANLPTTEQGEPFYTDAELETLRLPSKTMMDVPVITPNGARVHMICAHPTPPVFDGPEDRNGKRNHDEIRLIADYLAGEDYIADDSGDPTPFPPDASFVILGDMNADPDEGDSFNNPIKMLLTHDRVRQVPAPRCENPSRLQGELEYDDTATFGLRVDYALPSDDLFWTSGRIFEKSPTPWSSQSTAASTSQDRTPTNPIRPLPRRRRPHRPQPAGRLNRRTATITSRVTATFPVNLESFGTHPTEIA